MKRWQKWALGPGIAAAVLGVVWLAATWFLPTDNVLAGRLAAEAEARLGVKVTIGSVHWALLPTPNVVVNAFRTQQTAPVVIRQLSAHLNVPALMQGKLVIERLDIDGAVVPHVAVLAFRAKPDVKEPGAGDGIPLKHLVFRNLAWISHSGIAVVYDGEIDFDAHWRPHYAALRRPGITPPFTLTMMRDGDADSWQTRIHVGGGTADGTVALKSAASGAMHLSGQLAPHDIEVASALNSFNRHSSVGGKASGNTVLSADGNSMIELVRSLHSRTIFSVNPATVLRFRLDEAINTRGQLSDGETALQLLTGQMDTQNTDKGLRVTYTKLNARAGIYSVTGEGVLYDRQIDASGTVYLVAGAVGMPFTLRGAVETPTISVPPGFLAGAAIGTVMLPGIGTAIGARIGSVLDRLFQSGTSEPVVLTRIPPKKD